MSSIQRSSNGLSLQIARILFYLSTGIPPHHIVCITFTNTTANEIKERIDRLILEQDANLIPPFFPFIKTLDAFFNMVRNLVLKDFSNAKIEGDTYHEAANKELRDNIDQSLTIKKNSIDD